MSDGGLNYQNGIMFTTRDQDYDERENAIVQNNTLVRALHGGL